MDVNAVTIAGRLAVPPELRQFEGGARAARFLVTTKADRPRRRVDVLPVTLWLADDDDGATYATLPPGTRVAVSGSVQRRFWADTNGRRSRLEIVADSVATMAEVSAS